jgi:hypothetical protein
MKKYYVYKLTDKITNEFYFGSRSCLGEIEDDNYMGSMVTWKPNKKNLIKEIIKSDFLNREDCIKFEKDIIKNNIDNALNRNYHIPNEKCHRDGSAGMLFKNVKILNEYAKKYGVEIKSKWGIEEQDILVSYIEHGVDLITPHEKNPSEKSDGFKFKIAKP